MSARTESAIRVARRDVMAVSVGERCALSIIGAATRAAANRRGVLIGPNAPSARLATQWGARSTALPLYRSTALPLYRSTALPLYEINLDRAPVTLTEAQDAQDASRQMAREYREPDVDRLQRRHLPYHEADAERNDDLGGDRDVERRLGVSRPLQPARIRQRRRNREAGHTQHAKQLHADVHDSRIVHAEDRQQLAREEQEEQAHENGNAEAEPCRDTHDGNGAIRILRTEVLARDCRRRTHESHARPRDE